MLAGPAPPFERGITQDKQSGIVNVPNGWFDDPRDLIKAISTAAPKLSSAPLRLQISLGHASIQTTERCLGMRQNLHDAPCGRLGLVGWEGEG